MEAKVNYTIVGIFVISLTAVIVLAIIWLSSGFSFEQYATYRIYMKESVSGLNIDSTVEYNGVQVGSVSSIEINHDNPQLVDLLINIKKNTPITAGTVATVQSRGLTGVTFVALTDKSEDLRPLEAQPGEPYPVIPTAPSLFFKVDAALTKLTQNFQKITKAIDTLLDEENQRSIKEVLYNMRQASRDLTPLMNSAQSTLRMLEAQTLPETYRLLYNLGTASQDLSDLASQIKQNPSVLIRGVSQPPLGPGERNGQ